MWKFYVIYFIIVVLMNLSSILCKGFVRPGGRKNSDYFQGISMTMSGITAVLTWLLSLIVRNQPTREESFGVMLCFGLGLFTLLCVMATHRELDPEGECRNNFKMLWWATHLEAIFFLGVFVLCFKGL